MARVALSLAPSGLGLRRLLKQGAGSGVRPRGPACGRGARPGPTPGRLLPRRDASPAVRSPRGHGPHQGRRGCAHAVAQEEAPGSRPATGLRWPRLTGVRRRSRTSASSPTGHCQSGACFRRGAAVSKLSGETRPGQRPKCPRTIVRETQARRLGIARVHRRRLVTLAVYAAM